MTTSANRIYRQLGRYRVHFHELRTPVIITLWLDTDTDHIMLEYSHLLKTPTQMDAYAPEYNRGYDPTAPPDGIVSRMVSILDSYIVGAIAAGHAPSESWLVPVDEGV